MKNIQTQKNQGHYCHYLGFWYCPNCISKEKRPLWWKAVEEFDMTPYEVSNDAKKEIDELMKIPNLELKRGSALVRSQQKLKEFLVKRIVFKCWKFVFKDMKKKIHLMFDVICDSTIMLDILQNHANLALELDLLSLWNFCEIKDGSMFRFMDKVFILTENHITNCKVREKKNNRK